MYEILYNYINWCLWFSVNSQSVINISWRKSLFQHPYNCFRCDRGSEHTEAYRHNVGEVNEKPSGQCETCYGCSLRYEGRQAWPSTWSHESWKKGVLINKYKTQIWVNLRKLTISSKYVKPKFGSQIRIYICTYFIFRFSYFLFCFKGNGFLGPQQANPWRHGILANTQRLR